eukprot:645236-Prymnesium_polylepis.1
MSHRQHQIAGNWLILGLHARHSVRGCRFARPSARRSATTASEISQEAGEQARSERSGAEGMCEVLDTLRSFGLQNHRTASASCVGFRSVFRLSA